MATEHLHQVDCPNAVKILIELLGSREPDVRIPFSRTVNGVELDWEALANSPLSVSELVTIQLAHAIARIERHGGGFPVRVRASIVEAVKATN